MKLQFSVKTKLLALVGLGIFSLLMVFGINYLSNQKTNRSLEAYDEIFRTYEKFDLIKNDIRQMEDILGEILLEKTDARSAARLLKELSQKVREDERAFAQKAKQIFARDSLEELENYINLLATKLEKAISLLEEAKMEEFKAYLKQDLAKYLDLFEEKSAHIAENLDQKSSVNYQKIVTNLQKSQKNTGLVFVLALIFLIGAGFMLSRKISDNLEQITAKLQKISRGRFEEAVAVTSQDELGALARACNSLITGVGQILKTLEIQTEALTKASENLSRVQNTVDGNAQEIGHFAREVAAAAEQVTENLKLVSQSLEELTVATQEIAQNVNETANIAQEARHKAEGATHVMATLKESSQKIGQIIQVINQIADQTNLLALNATIEAARAGEAGKGFAVVANEVKELARQTSEATEEIASMVSSIQTKVDEAVEAVNSVDETIAKIGDLSSNIASATEEQTATTEDISRSVQEGINGVVQVNEQIKNLAEKAGQIEKTTASLKLAEEAISDIVGEIQTVNQFFTVKEEALEEASQKAEEGVRVMGMTFQHFQWREKLLEGILAYEPPKVQTDPSLCALGKWLAQFRPANSEQERILSRLIPEHQELHRSALKIIELIQHQSELEKVFRTLKEDISPRVEVVVNCLKELRTSLERAA